MRSVWPISASWLLRFLRLRHGHGAGLGDQPGGILAEHVVEEGLGLLAELGIVQGNQIEGPLNHIGAVGNVFLGAGHALHGENLDVSSHNLAELDTFCNKISIIKNGEIVETSDIETFKKDIKKDCYILEVEDTSIINSIIDYKNEILTEREIRIYIEKSQVPMLLKELILRNIKVYSIAEENLSLEDAFLDQRSLKNGKIWLSSSMEHVPELPRPIMHTCKECLRTSSR